MTIGGNVSSVGSTLRKEVTSNSTVVIPISDYKIVNASKLSSFWIRAHFATDHIISWITEKTTLFARYATILKTVMVQRGL